MRSYISIGDKVSDSPVGAGKITGISDAGYPQVDHVTVTRLICEDGTVYDPFGHYAKIKKQIAENHSKVDCYGS